jgi:nucleoside-diphosphate-sugar epimerase
VQLDNSPPGNLARTLAIKLLAVLRSGIYAELCCEKVGISYQSHHVTSSGYQAEYSMLVGNSETIRGLGWSPKVNIESLVARMVESEILSRNDKNNV